MARKKASGTYNFDTVRLALHREILGKAFSEISEVLGEYGIKDANDELLQRLRQIQNQTFVKLKQSVDASADQAVLEDNLKALRALREACSLVFDLIAKSALANQLLAQWPEQLAEPARQLVLPRQKVAFPSSRGQVKQSLDNDLQDTDLSYTEHSLEPEDEIDSFN